MLLLKKKKYSLIFEKYYKYALKQIAKLNAAGNAEFELLPAIFVICDYAAASAGKDRNTVANEILSLIHSKYIAIAAQNNIFNERIDFYGEVIRGRSLRADWFLGDMSSIKERNAIINCLIALGDILINPNCAENYDGAPIVIRDFTEVMGFASIMMGTISDSFVSLFKEVYNA